MTRILDFSTSYAGRYASRLLADQGYDVVAVELPEASAGWPLVRDREIASIDLSRVEAHLSRNKTLLALDFADDGNRAAVARLIAGADIVLHSLPADLAGQFGLDRATVAAANPATLLVTLTAYGHAHADQRRRASEKTLYAHGGAMLIGGKPSSDRQPFAPNAPVVSTIGGIYAAMTVLAECFRRRRDGRAFAHVDIALRDLLPMCLERVLPFYTYMNAIAFRGARRERMQLLAGMGDFAAKDGLFHVFAIKDSFRQLALLLDRPDLLEDKEWLHPHLRTIEPEDVERIVAETVAVKTVEELAAKSRELGLPSGVIVEVDQLAARQQLRHRRALTRHADGTIEIEEPYRFLRHDRARADARAASDPAAVPPPAAAPDAPAGDGRARRGPLDGIRVLDLTHAYAGPSATRILADLGAEVVKVESVTRVDTGPRGLLPFANQPTDRWWERAGYFAERNTNKKGLTLDLTTVEGKAILVEMIGQVDVIASNFTPRVMRNWGLAPEQLLAINPRIVALAMSGFGGSGPDSERPALAGLIEASSGFTSIVRYGDDEGPTDIGFSFGDMVSGLYAALSILIALDRRDATGAGDGIDLSCAEAPLPFLISQLTDWAATGGPPSVESEVVGGGRHLVFRAVDGDEPERWVIVFATPDDEAALRAELGEATVDAAIDSGCARIDTPRDALVERLRGLGLAAAPLANAEDILFDDELRARAVFTVVTRQSVGPLPHSRAFAALRNGSPIAVDPIPAPGLGEHNAEILSKWGGLGAPAIDDLAARGGIGTEPTAIVPKMLTMPVPLGQLAKRRRLKPVPGAAQKLADSFGYPIEKTA